MSRILIIGAGGQIGSELLEALRKKHGTENVIAADIRDPQLPPPFEQLDILDANRLLEIVKQYEITEIYLLAALLSATAEKNPEFAWRLNMEGLFNVLNLAKDGIIEKVFWPSSIAVFGPSTPQTFTPQDTVMDPSTVYGISKLAGERWCEYYANQYGVDVRSLRYPGIISWKSKPGGGTTDYAVDIFYEALENEKYTCFLDPSRTLPMMFMDDAVKATIDLMEAKPEEIQIKSSYNLAAVSFCPEEIASEIKRHMPNFEISYSPDFRDNIAKSWPQSIDDSAARSNWGWSHQYDLARICENMLENLSKKLKLRESNH